jgi:hypothetical protein
MRRRTRTVAKYGIPLLSHSLHVMFRFLACIARSLMVVAPRRLTVRSGYPNSKFRVLNCLFQVQTRARSCGSSGLERRAEMPPTRLRVRPRSSQKIPGAEMTLRRFRVSSMNCGSIGLERRAEMPPPRLRVRPRRIPGDPRRRNYPLEGPQQEIPGDPRRRNAP